ncbi:putative signal transduction histidine kinase [Novosphingobium nitrogenifigens DSM 19370]|uniref:histidine kinase n=1 Tax=Novosphingobium nitrogenifigens DSM 19370 TaxID=983920 RepID=F1Z764_9SPHN|nr:histidine kinase [Novosphingobium nitrogenifigens]EGD59570.1 putative signal transduction histidine kinase [Novosphingobium nitrogenifigens DSM 19370]
MFLPKRNAPETNDCADQRLPRSHSGLVLAGMRNLVALFLVLWFWMAPSHAGLGGTATAALLVAYLVFALILLAVAWRSWWYEVQLGRPAFIVDVITLLSALFLTKAVALDFFSPFIPFFAFLTLNSAARWSARSVWLIAGGLVLGFLLTGWLVDRGGLSIDMARFARRFGSLALLAVMLVWFAFGRQLSGAARYERQCCAPMYGAFGGVLRYAMDAYGARGGVLAWLDEGETRPHLHAAGTMEGASLSLSGGMMAGDRPFLFGKGGQRRIVLMDRRTLSATQDEGPVGPIAVRDGDEGLAIPIGSRTGRGQLLLYGISGMNSDDLFTVQGVAREIAAALDEDNAETLAREVALSRLRSQIATDLHDSVIQTLAGTRFRLQALRNGVVEGKDIAPDIDMICAGIAGEQDHVRTIIEQLRQGRIQPGHRDLREELRAVCAHLARHWMIRIAVAEVEEPVMVSAALCFEVQQILREVTANAVRHGKATAIDLEAACVEGRIRLEMIDNGEGFAVPHQPRSIAGRVAWLGGDLTVTSVPGRTAIVVSLPMGFA